MSKRHTIGISIKRKGWRRRRFFYVEAIDKDTWELTVVELPYVKNWSMKTLEEKVLEALNGQEHSDT